MRPSSMAVGLSKWWDMSSPRILSGAEPCQLVLAGLRWIRPWSLWARRLRPRPQDQGGCGSEGDEAFHTVAVELGQPGRDADEGERVVGLDRVSLDRAG